MNDYTRVIRITRARRAVGLFGLLGLLGLFVLSSIVYLHCVDSERQHILDDVVIRAA